MSPFFFFGPLHCLFMLLTLLGVILLMIWLIRYAKKETLIKVATWFLIVGIVGSIATAVGVHMFMRDKEGNVMFMRGHHTMEERKMMDFPGEKMLFSGEKSVKLAPVNTNATVAPLNSNAALMPVNANQNS